MRKAVFDNPNFYDYVKHMTTLSTASLVLIVTFADKIATQAAWSFLFKASVVFFLLTIVASLICMFFMLSLQRYGKVKPPYWEESLFALSLIVSWGFFLGGVISLAIFSIKNVGP